jgi:hypothetical protein
MMDENEKEGIHRLDILTETQDMVSIAFAPSCQFCQLTGLVHNITLVLVQQPVPLRTVTGCAEKANRRDLLVQAF